MGVEGAVILYRREIEAAEDKEATEKEFQKLYREQFASLYQAAEAAMMTDVITPARTRVVIARSLHISLPKHAPEKTWKYFSLVCRVLPVMQLTTVCAITIPTAQEMTESLTTMGTGFVVVMSVLCFLWLSISVIGKFFVIVQARAMINKDTSGIPNTHTSPAEELNDSISATTLTLIAAAVQTTINGPFRIVDVENRDSSDQTR